MFNQTRTNQGGSVVSFLVVGVVLAALLFGGVYLVRQRNQPSQPVSSPSPAPTQVAGPTTSPTRTPALSPSIKPSASPAPTSQPMTGTAPSGKLPTTGPSEDLMAGIVPVALLTATVTAYLGSRRSLRR